MILSFSAIQSASLFHFTDHFPMMPDQRTRKIIMVGDAGVGKTSVMFTYVEGTFRNHFPTIGAGERTKVVDVNGTRVLLDIWDTAGQERYRSQIRMYVTGAAVAIVMFDVNDRTTLENLDVWVQIVRENSEPDTKYFIVGNKTDLEKVPGSSQAAGDAAATKYAAEGYFETSAAKNTGIDTLFAAVAVAALKVTRGNEKKVELGGQKKQEKGGCC
jgi:small GTP-binding protein